MARKGVSAVVTVGNRRESPREAWGWRDWEDEERLQLKLTSKQTDMLASVRPPGSQLAAGFTLFPRRRKPHVENAQSRGSTH
jgi:hypothetical protein